MFDAMKAASWRSRFIAPALRQAALRNGDFAGHPDLMILVELWLWAVFFRFSGDYRALAPEKQAKLRNEAFQLSYFDYYNLHRGPLAALMREVEPQLGLTDPSKVLISFQQLIRPTFEHSVAEAQRLPPLHESFDLAAFRLVLSKVHPTFLEMTGGALDARRQHGLKLITQVVAVGQAQLYAALTGLLIRADVVLIDEAQIPDIVDIFISYARPDGRFVAELAGRLEGLGLDVWYDRYIQPESLFDKAISDQIAAAKVVLSIWSSDAVNSKWVRAESLAGFDANKLLQIRYDDCSIPTPFNIVQTIHAGPEGLTPEAFGELAQAIMRLLGQAPGSREVVANESVSVPPSPPTPWYFDHETWREALIVPALRESEPLLYLRDPELGVAAPLLLETFFWGCALNILQYRVPSDRMEHIASMLCVTAPTQYCDAARQRGANIDLPVPREFITLFHGLIGASVSTIESELQAHGKFETPVQELFTRYLAKSETTVPRATRHAAFPLSKEAGDALLGIAALAGSTALFEAINSKVLQHY